MNLHTCTDGELMAFTASRLAGRRVTPEDAARFLMKEMLFTTLRRFQGHQVRSAYWLGMSRASLVRHMKEFGFSSKQFYRGGQVHRKSPVSVRQPARQESRA